MSGAEDIAAELQRQIEVEGYTPEHDERHAIHRMVQAAGAYIGLSHAEEALAPPADWYRAPNALGDDVIWARRPGGNHDVVIATRYDTSDALWEWLERVVPDGEPGDAPC